MIENDGFVIKEKKKKNFKINYYFSNFKEKLEKKNEIFKLSEKNMIKI